MKRFINWYFGIGSEDHRQVYWGWREYPRGMAHSMFFGFLLASMLAAIVTMVLL